MTLLATQLAQLATLPPARRTTHQPPRLNVVPKYQRMEAAYNALPETGTLDTREVAVKIETSVHRANRALQRLADAGRIRKAGTRPAGHTFLNLWERT